MDGCFWSCLSLSRVALHKSLKNKEGFGRIPFKPCWQPSNAQSHMRLTVEIGIQSLHQYLTLTRNSIHLFHTRLWSWQRNPFLPKCPVFLQKSPENLHMTIPNPEWHSQDNRTQHLCYLYLENILHHKSPKCCS